MNKIIKMLIGVLLMICFSISQLVADDFTCSTTYKPCVRKDFRSLSSSEKTRFITAFKKLNQRTTSRSWFLNYYTNTVIDNYAYTHVMLFSFIHTTSTSPTGYQFLPWHRRFLIRLELELQKIDPGLCLAYWKWSEDYHNEMKSLILQDQYFGSDGNSRTNCLQNGQFKDWQCMYDDNLNRNLVCLSRRFNGSFDLHLPYNTDTIQKAMNSFSDYTAMTHGLEGIHNAFHASIGGHMARRVSCYDPFFWLHHVYIDKIWSDWQLKYPGRLTSYSGNLNEYLNGTLETAYAYLNYTNMTYCYQDYKSSATILRDEYIATLTDTESDISNEDILSEEKKIETPAQLTTDNMKTMDMNEKVTRWFEKRMNSIVKGLNNDPFYIPPHIFHVNNRSKWRKLLKLKA